MKTNQEKYVWGLFYFNREDPRVIMPKINRWMGWTLNFASPWSYILLFVFIFLVIWLGNR